MNPQRSDSWWSDRLGRATASRFLDITAKIGGGKYGAMHKNYLAELVLERITGQRAEGFTSQAMQWGITTEPLAKLRYTLQTGNVIDDVGFIKHPKLEAGASPDGVVAKLNRDIEIKCFDTSNHLEMLHTNKIPYKYVPQCQGQLWIGGYDDGDFISFDPRFPENSQLVIVHFDRDEEYIKQLEQEVTEFLAEVDVEERFVRSYGRE